VDNQEFLSIMNISKRLAQNWRDDGVIGFIMVGNKIYYKMSDIHAMLDKHYKQAK
jgi:3-methyladenine DNA glycosylase Tag